MSPGFKDTRVGPGDLRRYANPDRSGARELESKLQFHVNPSDEVPMYRQIVRQVRSAIAGGVLVPGDRLPSHRELAQQLVIAPLTVKKAYDELVQSGQIEMARGQGTFIRENVQPFQDAEKLERIRPVVQKLVSEAALLGIGIQSLVQVVREGARELRGDSDQANRSTKEGKLR